MKKPLLDYLIRVGDALSQLVNVVFLFGKNPNESISGRAYRLQDKNKAWMYVRVTIDLLASVWEKEHCKLAYEGDVRRAKELLDIG
jgi:hypothetical protein